MSVIAFIERWICCATSDSEEVLSDIRTVRENPDALAMEYVAYNHDSVAHHVSTLARDVVVVDNGGRVAGTNEVQVAPGDNSIGGATESGGREVSEEGGVATPQYVIVGDVECLVVTEAAAPSVLGDGSCVPTPGVEGHEPTATSVGAVPAVPEAGPSSTFRVCHDVVEVKQHRRVIRKHRGKYIASVVSEIKNKLGLPKHTDANRLAVRRMAKNIMDKHGVRPTHVRECIEVVIAGVFVPDEQDLRGAKMLASNRIRDLREECDNARPLNAWQLLRNRFLGRGSARATPP